MMTRQHFEAIANTLDANRADLALVQDFADMLSEQNPRFNRALFIKASTENIRMDAATQQRILDREFGKV